MVQDSIQAKMKDGVLELTIEKQEGGGEEVKSIQIE
jgi:HSP20 family molecular chaperone IbpA